MTYSDIDQPGDFRSLTPSDACATLSSIKRGADMWRRKFIAGLAGTIAFPVAARAQTPNRIYRLGHLSNSADSEAFTRQITLPELARLGFTEGRNLVFDGRVGDPDSLPSLMRELLAGQPDAVVAVGPAIRPAGAATRTVPVVTFGFDPIELGLAAGYARPGGNVTGVVILVGELEAKRLSILHEAVPDRRRVAALVPAESGANEAALRKAAGKSCTRSPAANGVRNYALA
jgi:putative tryptophan/tyrosine transport system substrate-binding protein